MTCLGSVSRVASGCLLLRLLGGDREGGEGRRRAGAVGVEAKVLKHHLVERVLQGGGAGRWRRGEMCTSGERATRQPLSGSPVWRSGTLGSRSAAASSRPG